jgi:hypothetical protein
MLLLLNDTLANNDSTLVTCDDCCRFKLSKFVFADLALSGNPTL